jgi:hypothetical protein
MKKFILLLVLVLIITFNLVARAADDKKSPFRNPDGSFNWKE